MKLGSILTAGLVVAVVCGSVSAGVVYVDLGTSSGDASSATQTEGAVVGQAGDFWNAPTVDKGTPMNANFQVTSALLDPDGNPSGITMTGDVDKGWDFGTNASQVEKAPDDVKPLYQDFWIDEDSEDDLDGAETITLAGSGLAAGDPYTLYVYCTQWCKVTVGQETKTLSGVRYGATNTGLTEDEDYVVFSGTIGSNGELEIAYGGINEDANGSIAGFQLVPEPATLAILGLGGLGVLRRRKN